VVSRAAVLARPGGSAGGCECRSRHLGLLLRLIIGRRSEAHHHVRALEDEESSPIQRWRQRCHADDRASATLEAITLAIAFCSGAHLIRLEPGTA
jgi:hypothetical protein